MPQHFVQYCELHLVWVDLDITRMRFRLAKDRIIITLDGQRNKN